METKIIDMLFLELSQVTTARTQREIQLEKAIKGALRIKELWLPSKVEIDSEFYDEYKALSFMHQTFIEALKTT